MIHLVLLSAMIVPQMVQMAILQFFALQFLNLPCCNPTLIFVGTLNFVKTSSFLDPLYRISIRDERGIKVNCAVFVLLLKPIRRLILNLLCCNPTLVFVGTLNFVKTSSF